MLWDGTFYSKHESAIMEICAFYAHLMFFVFFLIFSKIAIIRVCFNQFFWIWRALKSIEWSAFIQFVKRLGEEQNSCVQFLKITSAMPTRYNRNNGHGVNTKMLSMCSIWVIQIQIILLSLLYLTNCRTTCNQCAT